MTTYEWIVKLVFNSMQIDETRAILYGTSKQEIAVSVTSVCITLYNVIIDCYRYF